jgi:DNA repair protein RadA/Sms
MADPRVQKAKCLYCKHELPLGKSWCINPSCRQFNFPNATVSGSNDVMSLGDVARRGVQAVPRYKMLSENMDRFFGSGLAITSCNLIGGRPGSGKTTILLMLSDHLSILTGKKVAYVANEQTREELTETALRLEIKNLDGIMVINAMGGLQSNLFYTLKSINPCFMIVDSLSKLVGRDLELGAQFASDMKDLSAELKAPSMLVNQVTKDLDHAGLEKLQHAVDMTCLFYFDLDNPKRMLVSEKNRFGEAPLTMFFEMTAKGLVEIEENEDQSE